MHEIIIGNKTNNFDFIRFCAAIGVLYTHSFVLTGKGLEFDLLSLITNQQALISTVSLSTFFIISGYLIAKSVENSKSFKTFLNNRLLRIFPGLFVCIILTILVLGPITTYLPLNTYFSDSNTWGYFINLSIYRFQLALPGVFTSNTVQTINGSIWTLGYEFLFYILLFLASVLGLFRKRHYLILIFISLILLHIYMRYNTIDPRFFHPIIYTIIQLDFLVNFGLFFLAGVLIYLYRNPLNRLISKFQWYIFLFMVTSFVLNLFWLIQFITLPFLVIYLSFHPAPNWCSNWAKKYGDLSYGIYIYGMPVQQTLVMYTDNNLSPNNLTLFSLIILIPVAMFSWHCVEKKALKFKSR